jgi:hypothetical protein
LRYDVGSLLNMGPGYVPLALGGVLAALGVATVVKAYVAPDPAPEATSSTEDAPTSDREDAREDQVDERLLAGLKLRPILLVTAAILFFAYTVDGLGLLPASFGAGALASFAGSRPLRGLLISAGITVASYIIFVVLLQLRLSLVGDWLGG